MKKISDSILLKTYATAQTDLAPIFAASRIPLGNDPSSLQINEMLDEITKKEKLPSRLIAADLVKKGLLIPLVNREKFNSIPSFLPIINVTIGNRVVSYINLLPYIRGAAEGEQVTMSRRTLMALLIGSSIVNKIATNPGILSNSKALQYTSTIYARMLFRALDRVYGLSQNTLTSDQLRYLFAKFYLIGLMEIKDDNFVNSLAIQAIDTSNQIVTQSVDTTFGIENYTDLNSFVDGLSKHFSKLTNLSVRTIYKEMAVQYKPASVMAIEYAPYLPFLVIVVLLKGSVINEPSFETLLGREGMKLFQELDRLLT